MTATGWNRFSHITCNHPERPAIVQGDRTVSFAELAGMATSLGSAIRIAPGDRIMLAAHESAEYAAAILACWQRGAIPAILHPDSPCHHFDHARRMTNPALELLGPEAFPPFLPGISESIGISGLEHDRTPASILFTSGSTGLPKGVAQSHANLAWGCEAVGRALGYRADDRLLCAIPWAFDYGWGHLLSTLLLGITQILPDGRASQAICEAIERHRPTILPGVPSLFGNMIRGITPIRDLDLSSIRLVTNTGSKIPPGLFDEMLGLFERADISLNYGLTETYRSATLPFALAREVPDSVGYALPGAAIAVIDEDGRECAAGMVGEIVHRGAGVFLGYWGEAERTALALRSDPLWRAEGLAPAPAVFTGDLGWKDEAGRLYIKGRRDRQLKSMGVRVSPDEVEQLIDATGLVAEVAIIARPHEILGDQIVAVYASRQPGHDPVRELKRAARQTMSPFMQPMVWICLDRLPRTPSAKIDYPALMRDHSGARP